MVRKAGLWAPVCANWTTATPSADDSAHGTVWLLGLGGCRLPGWEQLLLQGEMQKPGNPGEKPALLLTTLWPGQVVTPSLGSWVRMGSQAHLLPAGSAGAPRGPGYPVNTNNGWHAIPRHLCRRLTASQTQGEASRREAGAGHSHTTAPTGPFRRRERKSRNHQLSKWHTVGPQGPPCCKRLPAFWVAATSPSGDQPGGWGGPSLQPRTLTLSLGSGGHSRLLPEGSL